jgi:single-strand DNA-binding protein
MTAELVQALRRAATHEFRGRLGRDPEMKYLQTGSSVCNANLAVDNPEKKNRDDGKQPDWIKLEIWFEEGENFANQLKQGDLVDVKGRIRVESWTDKQSGEQRNQLVLKVHHWAKVTTGAPAAAKPAVPVFDSGDVSDEEVPF